MRALWDAARSHSRNPASGGIIPSTTAFSCGSTVNNRRESGKTYKSASN